MKRTRACIIALGIFAASLCACANAAAASPGYEQGLEAVDANRDSVALMHFTAAAEQGDRDAQRSLGLMLLYGDRLYGRDVARDRKQGEQWLRAAAAQGCEVSAFMLKLLEKNAD